MTDNSKWREIFKEPSTLMIIVVLILLMAYGGISLIVELKPDSVTFSNSEQQLESEEWMALYEKRKQQQEQQGESSFYRFFEFRDEN